MSRRLAVVVAMIPIYTKGSTAEDKNIPHAHLIAVDQDTGKGVMLDLENVGLWRWRNVPPIPLRLLDLDAPSNEQLRSLHGSAPWERGETQRDLGPPNMPGDAQAAFEPRTVDSDVAEDR